MDLGMKIRGYAAAKVILFPSLTISICGLFEARCLGNVQFVRPVSGFCA